MIVDPQREERLRLDSWRMSVRLASEALERQAALAAEDARRAAEGRRLAREWLASDEARLWKAEAERREAECLADARVVAQARAEDERRVAERRAAVEAERRAAESQRVKAEAERRAAVARDAEEKRMAAVALERAATAEAARVAAEAAERNAAENAAWLEKWRERDDRRAERYAAGAPARAARKAAREAEKKAAKELEAKERRARELAEESRSGRTQEQALRQETGGALVRAFEDRRRRGVPCGCRAEFRCPLCCESDVAAMARAQRSFEPHLVDDAWVWQVARDLRGARGPRGYRESDEGSDADAEDDLRADESALAADEHVRPMSEDDRRALDSASFDRGRLLSAERGRSWLRTSEPGDIRTHHLFRSDDGPAWSRAGGGWRRSRSGSGDG